MLFCCTPVAITPAEPILSPEQWQTMAELCKNKGLVPFLDMAYQGFGSGLIEDTIGVRTMADTVDEMFLAISCSKNFGLYRERIGLLMAITKDRHAADAVSSQLINLARGIWSMPPAHGAALVATILGSDELTTQWEAEVKEMRDRINGLRSQAVSKLNAACNGVDFSFIEKEFGMFSFLGINPEQVARLKNEYGIYMVSSSRISVSGLNESNLDYFAKSVASVL